MWTQECKEMVLSFIPKEQASAKTSKELIILTGLPFRHLKEVITELRKDYPIVSKETNGGGYWIAENEQDLLDFVRMIEARRNGYDTTISKMSGHLVNWDFTDNASI